MLVTVVDVELVADCSTDVFVAAFATWLLRSAVYSLAAHLVKVAVVVLVAAWVPVLLADVLLQLQAVAATKQPSPSD